MSKVSPALARLRAATAEAHSRLEATLHIADPEAGREEYAAYVAAMWGWLAPLEAELWSGPWSRVMEASDRAVKRMWLREDLAAAAADGYVQAPLRVREGPAPFDSFAERIGFAYVIEGSMLGTQVLRKRLSGSLGSWPGRWLEGYGEEGGRRWRVFLEELDRELDSEPRIAAAAAAAVRAFDDLGDWMRSRGAA